MDETRFAVLKKREVRGPQVSLEDGLTGLTERRRREATRRTVEAKHGRNR